MSNSIFDQLNAIRDGDVNYYSRLSKKEQNSVSPFLLLKWLSSSKDRNLILALESFVNGIIFSSTVDKEMKWRVMAEVGAISKHKRERLSWLLPKKKENKKLGEMVAEYYEVSLSAAQEIIKEANEEELIDFLSFYGYDNKEAKKILRG